MEVRLATGERRPQAVAEILRALPEWFGVEASVVDYIEMARNIPTTAALIGDDVVGVCLVRHHTSASAEIELLAVRRDLHRLGIGRLLIASVEGDLRAAGCRLLQVKTFGPSGASEAYARTRAFYEALGFLPLEERSDIWGADNPCLISVKPLR